MGASNYEDLLIWKKGKEICLEVYGLTNKLPQSEKFGLCDQMRRSAVSIPSNIAEGFFRYQKKDFQRFLSISLGSCAELKTQIEISKDLGYVGENDFKKLKETLDFEMGMIKKFIQKMS